MCIVDVVVALLRKNMEVIYVRAINFQELRSNLRIRPNLKRHFLWTQGIIVSQGRNTAMIAVVSIR